MRRCSVIASATWRPMRCSGLRLVIGSWNTMPASSPRARCSVSGIGADHLLVVQQDAAGRIAAAATAEAAAATARSATCRSRIRRPAPGSRRGRGVNDTSSTTRFGAERDGQVLDFDQAHAIGSRRGSNASRTASPTKISSVSTPPSTKNAVNASHGACRLFLRLRDQFAERGRSRRQAEAEEIQRRQQGHRARQR